MEKRKQVINVHYNVVIEGNIYTRTREGNLIRLEIQSLTFSTTKELCKVVQN